MVHFMIVWLVAGAAVGLLARWLSRGASHNRKPIPEPYYAVVSLAVTLVVWPVTAWVWARFWWAAGRVYRP